ncbi:unnamed protein product [Linum tenue]|uniref:Transcriptional adapter n=1 Tax=Linum tenue TaxID=586396 RepID=A0AAV0NPX2_9ROSI|nr:unnamed protein product [Linum tenue]
MGRSRGNFQSADEDPTQRSRRKKNASTGENLESTSAGQGAGDGKKALYHCNYCNKDITGKIRIKCAMCPDFDLCIECFSVGAEMQPHKSSHPYRVMDMSHVVGKNRKELLAMAKGSSMHGEHILKEDSPFSPSRVKIEGGSSGRLLSPLNTDMESGGRPNNANASKTAVKKASDPHIERSSKGKKPNCPVDGPSLLDLSGYNTKRQEFDPAYDNDAEQLLAEMEFKENDTEEEREIKVRVLRIYGKRKNTRNCSGQSSQSTELSEEFKNSRKHVLLAVGLQSRRIDTLTTNGKGKRKIVLVGSKKGGQLVPNVVIASESVGKDSHLKGSSSYNVNELDITALFDTQLLSEAEKRLCYEIRLPPPLYLQMQEVMTKEIFGGNVSKKSDAHSLFKIDANKVDRVYDVLVKKGIAQP